MIFLFKSECWDYKCAPLCLASTLNFFFKRFNFTSMSVCLRMYVHNMCTWCLQRPEEGNGPLELGLHRFVSRHVGAGNRTLEEQSVFSPTEPSHQPEFTMCREPSIGSQHPHQAAQKPLVTPVPGDMTSSCGFSGLKHTYGRANRGLLISLAVFPRQRQG